MQELSREQLERIVDDFIYPKRKYVSHHRQLPESVATQPDLCAWCGGQCCQRCGCFYSPEDFKDLSVQGLARKMRRGYIAIEYVDGEACYCRTDVYILRVRNQGQPLVHFGGPRGTAPCVFWTRYGGCKTDYAHRPTGGRNMLPRISAGGKLYCHSEYDVTDCAREWLPYKRVVEEVAYMFRGWEAPENG